MTKKINAKEKKEQIFADLINKMFEIAGHQVTYNDVKGREDAWYLQWTMTDRETAEWLKWGAKYLQKKLNFNLKYAQREMQYIILNYGLKHKTDESETI
jgi:transcription initiation factor IIE alpha subunit